MKKDEQPKPNPSEYALAQSPYTPLRIASPFPPSLLSSGPRLERGPPQTSHKRCAGGGP